MKLNKHPASVLPRRYTYLASDTNTNSAMQKIYGCVPRLTS